MNIKITEEECNTLLHNKIFTVEFGNPDGKDTDLLHFVHPNYQMDICSIDNNHTLFYKDVGSNTDHLFITPRGFINGLITGANTLFYELIQDNLLEHSPLSWVQEYNYDTYRMLKALLGCSQRDFQQMKSHKEPEKKRYWSWAYLNFVRVALGGYYADVIDPVEVDLAMIKYTRKELTKRYENREVLFSVPIEMFNEISSKINSMKVIDIPELNSLQSKYYTTWSEN